MSEPLPENLDEIPVELPVKWRVAPGLSSEREIELLALADLNQAKWRAAVQVPFANLTAKERERGRAAILIKEAEHSGLPESFGERSELAEAYAICGLFQKAAVVAPDVLQSKEFSMIHEAIFRDDSETCGCSLEHRFALRDVFSILTNDERTAVKCNKCGFLNVIPLPDDLHRQREARKLARQLTQKAATPAAAKQILLSHGFDPKNRKV